MAARLGDILDHETSSHISFASYLQLPDFPPDVLELLENGDINLFEAEQLARVTAQRLRASTAKQSAHASSCSPLICKRKPRVRGFGSG